MSLTSFLSPVWIYRICVSTSNMCFYICVSTSNMCFCICVFLFCTSNMCFYICVCTSKMCFYICVSTSNMCFYFFENVILHFHLRNICVSTFLKYMCFYIFEIYVKYMCFYIFIYEIYVFLQIYVFLRFQLHILCTFMFTQYKCT